MSEPAPSADARVQERAERWSGRVTDDERLLGALPESASCEVMDWGLDAVEALAATTANLDDAAAEPVLDAGVGAIKSLMRTLGDVVDAHDAGDTIRLHADLKQLATGAADPALRSIIVDGKQRTTSTLAATLDRENLVASKPDAETLATKIGELLAPLPFSATSTR